MSNTVYMTPCMNSTCNMTCQQMGQVCCSNLQALQAEPPFSGHSALLASLLSGLDLESPGLNKPIIQMPLPTNTVYAPFIWQFQPTGDGGYYIYNTATQGVMQPFNFSMTATAPIVTARLVANNFQIWNFINYNPTGDPSTATYFIQNRATKLYLDISGDIITPGTQLIQYTLNPQSFFNQVFLVSVVL